MTGLTTDALGTACRIFLERAYPGGEDSIPAGRRLYLHLPEGQDLAAYHARQPLPPSTFQVIAGPDGALQGYSLRLGSSRFPHLKLKVLAKESQGEHFWIFAVDTHDAFSRDSFRPPPDHPDAEAWSQLQVANSQLKKAVEEAWEEVGLVTFNALLRNSLKQPGPTK